jgi:hypothetical protein
VRRRRRLRRFRRRRDHRRRHRGPWRQHERSEDRQLRAHARAPGGDVVKDPKVGDLAKTLQEQEAEHVDALTATAKSLGGTPAAKPRTNFQDVIAKGPKTILQTAATVENLGAAAYLGQAGNIKSKDILAAALSIHSVEARHAAALNELVGRGFGGEGGLEGSLPDGAFAKPMDMASVLKAVKPFLAS